MDHVAIMKKDWGFLPKILSGEKTIESRWYKNRSRPWGKIFLGDTVYFKDSGAPVTVDAQVAKVFETEKFAGIIQKYGKSIGMKETPKNKRYCILIFLKNVKKVTPFKINKKGFGAGTAWLTVEDINQIKL